MNASGSAGFGGESVTGAVYLHLSADFAKQVAGAMLGLRMNGGETMERVAKSSEKSEKHLEKIKQELEQADGLEFGV